MISKVSTLVLALAFALAWGTTANAQANSARYPITGTAQFQIGDGLPIPIAVPAQPVAGAGVRQPVAGADPRPMQFNGGEFTHPGTPINLPLFINNSNVFQVRTAVTIAFPNAAATFSAGGRTGAAVVSWCPGQVVTPTGNPGCLAPSNGSINGLLRYTATGAQFGGPARGATGGSADVALRGAAAAPCDFNITASCIVAFALATPAGTGAQGGAFGVIVSTTGAGPSPGAFLGIVAANGQVNYVTATGIGPGVPNPATSYGAPWTTGSLTISNTAAVGSPEIFTLQGSDNRVNGIGTISLVSGATSDRTLSGPNANRGWLSITVGDTAPALGTWGIGALALVLGGAAVTRLRKKA